MFSSEIEKSRVIKWALGSLIFIYFTAFYFWVKIGTAMSESADLYCPPYFQSCERFEFLKSLPDGYSETFFYMLLLSTLFCAVYFTAEKKWHDVQIVLMPSFFWHAYNVLFGVQFLSASYEYYLIGYGLILLFFPHKEFFLKLFLVTMYTLSVVPKVHASWIEGLYFANLRTGLPLFPDWSIPFFSNLVMVMEMVGAWFLLSKHRFLQRGTLIFFILFHFYSGIFVGFRYPVTLLPMLLIVFGPWYQYQKPPLDKKSVIGWIFIAVLIFMQFSPKLIAGDEKLTLEGNKYGLYMFESNHQCISTLTLMYKNGGYESQTAVSASSRDRCDPYLYITLAKNHCVRDDVERISWKFDHSINGDPFLRIVDEANVCDLEYHPFKHNSWIKTHEDNPEVIGYPVKNFID